MVMGKMTRTQIIMTPGLDNLHIITSGPVPPNPAELIDSRRLVDFIEEAREEYDMIMFDSPPILSASDAAILGTKVDRVLLVYRVGSVSRGLLKRATAQLEQVKCNLLGVVLNGMRPDVSPDFQDYYYYSYYHSYGEEDKAKKSHGDNKILALFRKKRENRREQEQKTESGEEETGPQKVGVKKLNMGRVSLLLTAAAFLVGAILWQGEIKRSITLSGAERPVKNDEIQTPAKRKTLNKSIPKRQGAVLTGPKNPHSVEEPGSERIASIPKPSPLVKDVKSTKASADKNGILSKKSQEKPKRASTKRKAPLVVQEPGSERIASRPKPRPLVKDVERTKTLADKESTSSEKSHKGTMTALTKHKTPVPVANFGLDAESHKTPVPNEKIQSNPYSIYLGSFRNLKRAKKAVSLYRKKGLSPNWVKVELSKGTWYRVYAGHFEDAKKAERYRKEHRLGEASIKKTRFANLIDIYTSSDKLEEKIQSLRNLGYSPYVIEDHHGKSLLLVGTFITREGADKQYHDLKSDGVENQVMER
jgi:cell division septation protein DedD